MINYVIVCAYQKLPEDDTVKALFILKDKGPKEIVGKWNFPGGKIKSKETAIQAATRELQEECGVLLIEPNLFMIISGKDNDEPYNLYVVTGVYIGEAKQMESEEIMEFPMYPIDFLSSDLEFAKNIPFILFMLDSMDVIQGYVHYFSNERINLLADIIHNQQNLLY